MVVHILLVVKRTVLWGCIGMGWLGPQQASPGSELAEESAGRVHQVSVDA